MTPISFALELLLDCTTLEQVHKRCKKYIKELERGQPTYSVNRAGLSTPAQAPSTQRLMDAQIQKAAPTAPPQVPQSKLVDNGDGTIGKRKW